MMKHYRDVELRFQALADAMPQMLWATDADGAHIYYNRGWYEYTGLTEEQSLGFGFVNALHPDDRERTLERWRRAWHDGEPYEIEYRFRRRDGVYRWFIGRARPVRDAEGRIIEWVGTCTNIEAQKRTSEALNFLVEATTLLSESLDYESTLARLAHLAVPHMADWCAIDIQEPDGSVRRLAVAHIDPEKVAMAQEMARRAPFDPNAPTGLAQVLRSGEPEMVPVITEEMVRQVPDPELRDMLLRLGLRSSMVVPLKARGRTLGAIQLVAAESQREFTATDLRLAEDLARRAGVAVDNARLYGELRQFRSTLDQTKDCVFMFDPDTLRFLYVNQGAIDHVGYSQDELLTMTPLDIKPEFTEQSYRAMMELIYSGERSQYTFETMHRHKDGHHIPVEVMLQYVATPDDSGRFVSFVRDISERRRANEALRASEQRYRALAEAMPLLVWIADPSGEITYVNRRWVEFTGADLGPDGRLERRDMLHPDDHERTMSRWRECVASGEPYEMEYRIRRHDGVYRWQLVRAVPVASADGPTAYWVGTNTDIDDQKRHEEALHDRTEQLARATATLRERNRELDQFAYITSHDLRAPLRGIANLAGWIEEDLGDTISPDTRSYLELMTGRVRRMEDLISGILHYSRVGRTGGAVEEVPVDDLLREVIDLLAPGGQVDIAVAPDMPTIRTERLLLHQVFSNLIGNAIKHYLGEGRLRIRVGHERRAEGLVFFVSDNGPGIAPQYHERIFGIFQTLAPRDSVEGSGLGLSLVKKIVEHQGGRIWLESDVGAGATFFFTWPAEHQ